MNLAIARLRSPLAAAVDACGHAAAEREVELELDCPADLRAELSAALLEQAKAYVKAAGGELLFQASAVAHPVALPGEQWDEVLLVRYPSIGAFFTMVMAPDYQAQSIHRTAALEDARLICTVESGTD